MSIFTAADILLQRDGALVVAIPVALTEGREPDLQVTLRPRGYDILDHAQVIGRIDRVPPEIITRLRQAGTVEILACPEDLDLTTARVHRAPVRLSRTA